MANDTISLVLLALDERQQDVFRMTLMSHEAYDVALQEVIGMGRVILKNEREVVRVEIHRKTTTASLRLAVLTRDDISFAERDHGKQHGGIMAIVRNWLWSRWRSRLHN